MDMEGGVAIITGSSSGVGAASAVQLAEQGANVVINYNSNEQGAEQTAEQCRDCGVEVRIVQGDIASNDNCLKLVETAMQAWGRVDALVNNAGTTRFVDHADLDGLSAEDFQRIYAVNTVGAFQMSRAVASAMREEGEGSIVNVASIAAITGVGSSIAYAASKGAMVTMTLSLARVLGPQIRVNAVLPGFIQGDWLAEGMGEERYARTKAHLESNAPLRLTVDPDTVAEAIMYFIVGARVVTGETLIVDGGHHLMQTTMARR